MSVDPIAAIAPLAVPQPPVLGEAAPAAPGFGTWFAQEAAAVNATVLTADNDVRKLAAGQAPSLHEVMIHLEEAKLSMQLLAQVRNRLLDAYQEVMRMQV